MGTGSLRRDAIADIEGVLEEVEGRTACKAGTRLL